MLDFKHNGREGKLVGYSPNPANGFEFEGFARKEGVLRRDIVNSLSVSGERLPHLEVEFEVLNPDERKKLALFFEAKLAKGKRGI